jgi:hypothetical protein
MRFAYLHRLCPAVSKMFHQNLTGSLGIANDTVSNTCFPQIQHPQDPNPSDQLSSQHVVGGGWTLSAASQLEPMEA